MHLDTHAVGWLFAGQVERFPAAALRYLETEPLAISPMVVLELQYLHEIGRIATPAAVVVADLARRLGLRVANNDFAGVVARAVEQSWTRDPFDRLIAAHALCAGETLLSADGRLRQAVPNAVWAEEPAGLAAGARGAGPPGTTAGRDHDRGPTPQRARPGALPPPSRSRSPRDCRRRGRGAASGHCRDLRWHRTRVFRGVAAGS